MTVASLILAALLAQAQAGNGVSADERKDGFVPLFDGTSLTGWQTIPLGDPPGAWVVRDGVLTHTPGDSWIATVGTYTDFILRLEYRTSKETDSGIFLRSRRVERSRNLGDQASSDRGVERPNDS